MNGHVLLVDGRPVALDATWEFGWVDRERGEAILRRAEHREPILVEGGPTQWVVTIHGRRIDVTRRSHRERLLAESGPGGGQSRGPSEVRATLPGLIVRVAVEAGDPVNEGDPLLTVEAMKMQNEIRAPRAGHIAAVEVSPGQTIAAGAVLVRLAEPGP